jgi:uncharacterized protein YecT (DUF1311 family)
MRNRGAHEGAFPMKFSILVTAFLLSFPALGADFAQCKPAGTQLEMTACAVDDLKTADDELNRTYKALLEKEKDNKAFVEKIRVAQKAWIAFRDAELEAIYACADPNPRVCWGSMFPMCRSDRQAKMTRERTKRLKELLESGLPADDCN